MVKKTRAACILVVDDEQEVRAMMKSVLKVGHRIPIVCTSGLVSDARGLDNTDIPPDSLLPKPFTRGSC